MSRAIENLEAAMDRAIVNRPVAGGFPHFAETLRLAGVMRNIWYLPSCQSLYLTNDGPVVMQATPVLTGVIDVPPFNRDALIAALRSDQSGRSSLPEFLLSAWNAGVVSYEVDFVARSVIYRGPCNESYTELYAAVTL